MNGFHPISRASTLAAAGSPSRQVGLRRNMGRSLLLVLLGCLSLLALPRAALAGNGSISGTVTEAGSKTPLAGIEVTVYSGGGPLFPQPVASGKTEANTGNYTIGGLAAGSYTVEFSDPLNKYAPQYYENVPGLYGVKRVLVEEAKAALGIDAELREGATISGTVQGGPATDPMVNAEVYLYPTNGESCTTHPQPFAICPSRWAPTDAGGKYEISGLPRGSYYVQFFPPVGQNLVPQFFEEADSLAFAKTVPIEEAKRYEINAKLKVGGEISGTVTDAATHTPLANVEVYAGIELFAGIGEGPPILRGAKTNANGEYTIFGLATGSYVVGFVAPYPYQYVGQSVKGVAATQGLTTSGISVALIRKEPVNTASPLLYGTSYVGHTLSCANGSWTGEQPLRFTYAWLRDGSLIGAGTRSTYVVQARDQGHGLACQVIAANLVSQGVTATSNPLHVPAAPTIENLKQSHSRWSESNKLATYSRPQKPPVGTTFTFALNEQATVSFAFTQQVSGRKVGGKCVPQTNRNRRRPSCERTVTRGRLSVIGHSGLNKVAFQGRIARSERLPLGAYTLVITARNSGGRPSNTRSLRFTIVR